MACRPGDLTPLLEARDAMKKNHERRNESILFATRTDNGTRKISDPSYGTFLILESTNPRVSVFFRFQIGPNSMFGCTSMRSRYRLCRCTMRVSARSWSETDRLY